MTFEWKGVFPALLTPFTDKDELDLDMFATNIDAQLAAGVHGIMLGGTLCEASVITLEEKEKLVNGDLDHNWGMTSERLCYSNGWGLAFFQGCQPLKN